MRKIKNLIIILTIFFSVGIIGIKHAGASDTYSEEFKKLTSGTLTLTQSSYDNDTNQNLVENYIIDFNSANGTNFEFLGCESELTSCSIGLWVEDVYETHEVSIEFKDVYSSKFQELTNNGNITVPKFNNDTNEAYLTTYFASFNEGKSYSFNYNACNDEKTICGITLYDNETNEIHKINITYKETWTEEYKSLFPNNTLIVTNGGYTDKMQIIDRSLGTLNKDGKHFCLRSCDINNSKCIIEMFTDGKNGYESHEVNIIFEEKYGEEFKKLTSGDLTVQYYNDNYKSIWDFVYRFNEKNNTNFLVEECNEDETKCIIILNDIDNNFIEQHEVNVIYKENFTEEFKKFAPDNKIVITNSDLNNIESLIYEYVMKFNEKNNTDFRTGICNDDVSNCKFYNDTLEYDYEAHNVQITYKDKYSDVFKRLTSDGNIVVDSSTITDKDMIISMYVYRYNDEQYEFYVGNYNEDFTKCVVYLSKIKKRDDDFKESEEIERHVVNVSFKEKISNNFKKLSNGNTLVVESIRPKTNEEAYFFITSYVSAYNTDDYYFYPHFCKDDFSVCDIGMYYSNGGGEVHTLKIAYSEINKTIQDKVMSIINQLPVGKRFLVEDLEMINYIVNGGYDLENFDINVENSAINYSTELKKLLGNGNITAKLDVGAGASSPFESHAFGGFLVLYDDIVYGLLKDGGVEKRHIIYIPDNTKDTTEAYIKAAEKRINEYLKDKKVKITYGGKSTDIDDSFLPELIKSGKRRDEFYILNYEGREFPFIIVKDSSKVQTLKEHATSDIFTNVTISMDSSSVPLDTSLKINEIKKDTSEYKEIVSKLGLEEALIYDLKLYSSSTGDYIKKLDDGLFEVSIPIPENLKSKDLVAYYIKDDGTKEEYKIEIKNGKAIFKTNHFSIYTIGEEVDVPLTYDGITMYIVLGLLSILGLVITVISLKTKKIS